MPIDVGKFEREGTPPHKEYIQENILRILKANPDKAFSSVELENALDTRRQGINQALRALETKGLIKRGFVEQNKRMVCFAKLLEQKEQDTDEKTMAQPEEVEEDIQEEEKPRKRKSKKRKSTRKSGKKRS